MPAFDGENAGIWNECLIMAIESFNRKSMGIAAIVTDRAGRIVSRGRNRLAAGEVADEATDGGGICGSSIAHAEINAIHNLGKQSLSQNDLTIFTSVEPCPMCLGAIAMSGIRHIVVASKDPHAGSIEFLNDNLYVKKKNISCRFETGQTEKIFFAIHYLSIMRAMKNRRPHVVLENMRRQYADCCDRIEQAISYETIDTLELTQETLYQLVSRKDV